MPEVSERTNRNTQSDCSPPLCGRNRPLASILSVRTAQKEQNKGICEETCLVRGDAPLSVLQTRLGWSPRKTTRARVNTQMASFWDRAHAEAIIRLSDRLCFCRYRALPPVSPPLLAEDVRRTLCELQPSEQRGTTVVCVFPASIPL